MSKKTWGIILIIVGIVVLAVSLLADLIGVGQYPQQIGTRQIIGALVGGIVFLVGIFLALSKAKA